MIPDKNLFIVSSCLIPKIGQISIEDRITQTKETFESIRKIPNSVIIFADASVEKIPENVMRSFDGLYDIYFDLSNNNDIKNLSLSGQKSQAETLLLLTVISQFKSNFDIMRLMHSVKRIFKISGRYKLSEQFDIDSYNDCFGKYVFKTRIKSWMSNSILTQFNSTDLLTTRLYSFCPSLIDDYINVLINNFQYLGMGFDTEHAHFLNINKKYLNEHNIVGIEGIIASNLEIIKE